MVTLTTPSECPVTMTFCVSHSFISDTQQHRICWLRPVKVLALAMGLPLILHTWMYVPAHDTTSPYTNINTSAAWLLSLLIFVRFLFFSSYSFCFVIKVHETLSRVRKMYFQAHRQFIDAQSRDWRPVSPELRDEGKFVEVPDDACSIPWAADNDVVRRWRSQTRYSIRVTQ